MDCPEDGTFFSCPKCNVRIVVYVEKTSEVDRFELGYTEGYADGKDSCGQKKEEKLDQENLARDIKYIRERRMKWTKLHVVLDTLLKKYNNGGIGDI